LGLAKNRGVKEISLARPQESLVSSRKKEACTGCRPGFCTYAININ